MYTWVYKNIMCSICECDVAQAIVCVHVCGVMDGEMKENPSTTVYNTFHNVCTATVLGGMIIQVNLHGY